MAKEGKKRESKPVNLEAEAIKTLLEIATADGPRRFVKGPKGSHAHLFAKLDEKKQKVVEKCREAGNEWVTVLDEGTPQERVELTPVGQARVADAIEEAGAKLPLGERLAYFQEDAQRTLIPAVRFEAILASITSEQAKEDDARAEAHRRIREAEEADARKLRAALEANHARKQTRIAAIRRELAAEGVLESSPSDEGQLPPATLPKLPFPSDDGEKDFRRQYARHLVAAWFQAIKNGNADGQRYLEAALYNMDGMQAIGEPGEKVKFDSSLHEPVHGADVGSEITIRHVGWLLQEKQGRYIVLRASAE